MAAKLDSKMIHEQDVPRGLRYVSDEQPGFARRRVGKKGFLYLDEHRERIVNEKTIQRIKDLVIPPAWEDVWICRFENGHLQVTGRDARDRKQYRYHETWTENRNETKFQRLLLFGEKLPAIHARLEHDLRKHGLPKEKVLAAVVQVMDLTRIRVGNEIYTQENDSYGLTTIRNEHAKISGSKVRFRFRGKSGVMRDLSLNDARLSRIIKQCQDLPGEELFCFEDEDGNAHDITSTDVNDYLKEISGEALTAKDFRTWGGTVKAIEVLSAMGPSLGDSLTAQKKRELEVVKAVAKHLGNTVTVCRKYYVHPTVFESDRQGVLHKKLKAVARRSKAPEDLARRLTLALLSVG
ncbi:hypothetical protein BH10BDE1_BH10BDE1_03690 [soil metagenome]